MRALCKDDGLTNKMLQELCFFSTVMQMEVADMKIRLRDKERLYRSTLGAHCMMHLLPSFVCSVST